VIFCDSSALIKKFVAESGSGRVIAVLAAAELIAVSRLAYPEIVAALGRKHREKGLTAQGHRQALDLLEHDWRELVVVELLEEFQPLIRRLAARHGLKGADLVHLASAIWIGKSVNRRVTFVGSDARLQRAAASEKLTVVNPED